MLQSSSASLSHVYMSVLPNWPLRCPNKVSMRYSDNQTLFLEVSGQQGRGCVITSMSCIESLWELLRQQQCLIQYSTIICVRNYLDDFDVLSFFLKKTQLFKKKIFFVLPFQLPRHVFRCLLDVVIKDIRVSLFKLCCRIYDRYLVLFIDLTIFSTVSSNSGEFCTTPDT